MPMYHRNYHLRRRWYQRALLQRLVGLVVAAAGLAALAVGVWRWQ